MTSVLLYVPNIIGYVRILLIALAFFLYDNPFYFILLYGISVLLDGVDGFCARKLNQTSAFGVWFDVVVDLLGRGLLWCNLFKWGYVIVFIEWLTFVSTQSRGENWKVPEDDFPVVVRLVMANGFKTPLGTLTILGIHILPICLYGYHTNYFTEFLMIPVFIQYAVMGCLVFGRFLCLYCEVFYNYLYVCHLLGKK